MSALIKYEKDNGTNNRRRQVTNHMSKQVFLYPVILR
jgi:hypothetical protein